MRNSNPDGSKEIIQFQPSSNDDDHEDTLLLNGEPFSKKSHWVYKVVDWVGTLSWLNYFI